jgi:hypothetical protein
MNMETTTVEAPTNELCVMDIEKGDVKIRWDRDNREEVAIAREAFKKAKDKGMLLFRTKRTGGQGDRLYDFDPEAERIVAVPKLVGG